MPDIAVIMRTRLTLVVLFLCTFLLAEPRTLYAQGQMVDVGIRFWKPSPELVLSSGGVTVDFVQDFGLEEEWFREYRDQIGRRQKLRVNFVRFEVPTPRPLSSAPSCSRVRNSPWALP